MRHDTKLGNISKLQLNLLTLSGIVKLMITDINKFNELKCGKRTVIIIQTAHDLSKVQTQIKRRIKEPSEIGQLN